MPKVLIVDDDRSMVTLLTTLLQLDGFEVIHEARGAEVLNAIRAQKPDVVLMDVHLSDADGLEILGKIRADAAIGKMPAVIASGEDVRYKCEQAGANDFILKPYSPDHLTETLKKAIGQ
ncbi:MAG: response regulator [Chloroflexota bacterium]